MCDPKVLNERTLWINKELERHASHFTKIYDKIENIDVIERRAEHIPEMLTWMNKIKGEIMVWKWIAGSGILGTVVQALIMLLKMKGGL